jgi:hypothetical protein
VHEGRFACERTANSEILFRDQREQPLEQWSHLPSVAADHDVQVWMDREFFEANIDSETCTPNWYAGDKMDWNMAVSALC